MHITVVGCGNAGLVAGACFADLGHEVILVDNDEQKVAALNRGDVPIREKFLPELLDRHRDKRLTFSGDLQNAVMASEVVFIAVGTPNTENGHADLSSIEAVASSIPSAINGYKVIVEKSTVPVYTNQWIRKIILRNAGPSDLFDVASNPEFLREGTAVTDFLFPDRIVVGADNERCMSVLRAVYAPLTDGRYYKLQSSIPQPDGAKIPPPLIVTSSNSAELIKHASNAFLAMKISFINAVASICESVDADVEQVCQGMGSDTRIGPRFLNPGIGYGGSSFAKDIKAFREAARECGYDFRLLDEVININDEQRNRFLRKVRSALWTLRGKRLAVLGLSFKGGTDDIRESPAILVVEALLKEGCRISVYDPAAHGRAREVLKSEVLRSKVEFAEDPYEASDGADALLILTEWDEFGALDLPRLHKQLKYPLVIDGRNLYDPQAMAKLGFTYHSIGRPAVIREVRSPQTDAVLFSQAS